MTSQPDSGSDSGTRDRLAHLIEKLTKVADDFHRAVRVPITERFAREHTADLRAAVQALSSPTPAWLPVESAPKDGTKFWAIDRHGRHFECRRISDRPGAPDVWHNLSANRWDFPTHWQPLPPPPSLIGEGNHE